MNAIHPTIRVINVYGSAGGVGTTTVAVMLAVLAKGVALGEDVRVMTGTPADNNLEGCSFAPDNTHATTLVVDQGKLDPDESVKNGDAQVLVVRNDYVSLKRAMTLVKGVTPQGDLAKQFTHLVVTYDPQRAIRVEDIASCTGMVPITLYVEHAIARATDAGILGTRDMRQFVTALDPIVKRDGE